MSRRDLLKATGAAALAGSLGAISYRESRAYAQGAWDYETDVVAVGSGAAALSAAVTAVDQGSDVIVVEKARAVGGTTLKSGGVYWIPNNSLQREAGFDEEKEDTLRLMAKLTYPALYKPNSERSGIPEWDYALMDTYYDEGPVAVDELKRIAGLVSGLWSLDGENLMPDYYHQLPENKQPMGRGLVAAGGMIGVNLITPLKEFFEEQEMPILVNHRVTALIQNDEGEIVGVRAEVNDWTEIANYKYPEVQESEITPPEQGEIVEIRARQGVVFGTGGFAHNREYRSKFLRGPIFGGGEMLTNEGDFIAIATRVGAQLTNMNEAYWSQVTLEPTLEMGTNGYGGITVGGDSVIEVNKYGHRVGSEKGTYNDFGQLHFTWDPVKSEYPNLVPFLICDERYLQNTMPTTTFSPQNKKAEYVISGDTIEELAANIDARLEELGDQVAGIQLHEHFVENLQATIERFNGFAMEGVDRDFHREEAAFTGGRAPDNDLPSGDLYPLAEEGPYHCVLMGAGVLGTKGGPKINTRAQVVDADNEPIPGLYGAGNCIGSPSRAAYWSGGGTLGPAIVYGYLAGLNVAQESIKATE